MGLYVFQKIEIWTPIWDPHGLPRASKIDPGALKITIFDLPGSVYDSGDDFWGQKNDSKRGAQPAAPDVIEKNHSDSKLGC